MTLRLDYGYEVVAGHAATVNYTLILRYFRNQARLPTRFSGGSKIPP
jgi:hypothetical protein